MYSAHCICKRFFTKSSRGKRMAIGYKHAVTHLFFFSEKIISQDLQSLSNCILLDVGPGLEMPNVGSRISTWPHGGLGGHTQN